MSVTIRPAKTSDIKAIRTIIDTYSLQRRLLSKETVMLYEDVQEFFVAEKDSTVIVVERSTYCGKTSVKCALLQSLKNSAAKKSATRL